MIIKDYKRNAAEFALEESTARLKSAEFQLERGFAIACTITVKYSERRWDASLGAWKTTTNLYCRNRLRLYINTIPWIFCLDLPELLRFYQKPLLQCLITDVDYNYCIGRTLTRERPTR